MMNLDGAQMLDRTFSLNVDDVFNMIFFDGPFFQSLLAKRNTYNISVGEWTDISQNNVADDLKEYKQYRNLSYTMDVNQSMAKTVSTTEVQYLYSSSTPGQAYVVKSEVSNMGFPLSSSFRVDTVYYLSRGETENECNLQIYGKVVFEKSDCGMKSLIEDSTIQGLSTYVDDLTRSLVKLTEPDLLNYKKNMNLDEAKLLTRNAVLSGIENDLASGGGIDSCIITPNGMELIVGPAAKSSKKLGTYTFPVGTTPILGETIMRELDPDEIVSTFGSC